MSLPLKGAGLSAAVLDPQMFYHDFTGTPDADLLSLTPNIDQSGNGWSYQAGDFDTTGIVASAKTLPGGYAGAYVKMPRFIGQAFFAWRNQNQFANMRHCVRYKDITNYIYVQTYCFQDDMKLIKQVAGVHTTIDSDLNVAGGIAQQTWYDMWIEDDGNNINVYHVATGGGKPGAALLTAATTDLAAYKGFQMYAGNTDDRWDNVYLYDSIVL